MAVYSLSNNVKVSQVLLLVETEVSQAILTLESNAEAPKTSQPDDALARFLKAFQGTKMNIKLPDKRTSAILN